MKKIATAVTLMLGLAFVSTGSAQAAEEVPGSSPENPIVVADPALVPEGAVEDEVSTYDTPEACDTTRSWVLTIPANEETSHEEFKFGRFVQGTEETFHNEWGVEKQVYTPGEEEVTKEVYSYKKKVVDYTTEYHFSKFTHTKTRTYTEGTEAVNHWWNWSPNNSQGPQDYTPNFPEDRRGTWQGPHVNGGPMQSTFGTFQTGGGNSPFFHREHISDAVEGGWGPWSDFGPWTEWSPETHTSWEDSTTPLGSPAFHGQGQDGNTQWYREWQAQHDGVTREVESGSHYEYTGETDRVLGEPWVMLRGYPKTVVVTEATEGSWGPWVVIAENLLTDPTPRLPENTDEVKYRVTGPVSVSNNDATEGYREFFVLYGEPSRNIEDASWVTAEQSPGEGWTQFDQRTVKHGDGTPEVVTYFAYTDGAECEKPEGFENTDTTEKCVNGDLVTTNSTETGTPVQAEDGSWTVEVTATSSQSVEEDALKCAPKDNPPPPNNPPSNPNVPTSVDAGLGGPVAGADAQDDTMRAGLLVGSGLLVMLAAGLALTHQRRVGTEK